MTHVTENDLLEALREALNHTAGQDGFTAAELAALSGRGEGLVRRGIRLMIAAGKVEVVQLTRTKMNGVTQRQAGYRLRP